MLFSIADFYVTKHQKLAKENCSFLRVRQLQKMPMDFKPYEQSIAFRQTKQCFTFLYTLI